MCGIYGITDNDTAFIKKYLELCSHRGPDGSNVWACDQVTLGHNLLGIMADPTQSPCVQWRNFQLQRITPKI